MMLLSRRQMQHLFSQVPKTEIPRSSFNRSHGLKTTLDAGYLVPILVDEVLPGDTFNCRASIFGRIATLISPIMDNVYLDTFFFFVPNRLIWKNWQRFCGEQDNPGDSTDFLIPVLKAPAGGFKVNSLADYFGIPTGVENIEVNALPFRAYNLIINEWFRDENLQDSLQLSLEDSDDVSYYNLVRRGKRHDYFTSALPWAQKGPGVELPLAGNAPIAITSTSDSGAWAFPSIRINYSDGGSYAPAYLDKEGGTNNASIHVGSQLETSYSGGYSSELYADLSSVSAATINDLRQAFQIQKWYERAARGGTRYTEILRSFFGVISPDARLQRPEYLGGSSSRMSVGTVAQTSSTNDTTPQANLAAFGVLGDNVHGFTKSFTEHGYIIGLVNIRADLTYQQGLNKMWSRQTKFDFYWPVFAHLGEQAVLNKEIYAQGTTADDDVFGYQERYAEYRYSPSVITGQFRSTYSESLDVWHLAQDFDNLPTLSSDFIEDNPPIDRVVAVTSKLSNHFLLDVFFDMRCVRPMPVYSVPGLVDHF